MVVGVSLTALVWKPLRQANTVRLIEGCGGDIEYSVLFDEHANEIKSWNFVQELMFPREYLEPIHTVDFRRSIRLSDACIERLVEYNISRKITISGMEHDCINAINASETNITNDQIEILSHMPGLAELSLRDTEITDTAVPILGKFKSLYFIDITRTQITPEGQQHLLRLLPHCTVEDLTSRWPKLGPLEITPP
jgi:hypothetical protein